MNYFSLQVIIQNDQQSLRACFQDHAGSQLLDLQLDFLEDLEIVVDDPQTKVVTQNF